MAPSITTDGNAAGAFGAFHDKRLLEVLENSTKFYQLGEKRPIEAGNGTTITFHYFSKMATGKRTTQGTQSAAQFMTASTVTATLIQFDDTAYISDMVQRAGIVNILSQLVERFGYSAGRTIDEYIQDRLYADQTEDYSVDSKLATHQGPRNNLQYGGLAASGWYHGIKGGMSAVALSGATSAIMTSAQFVSATSNPYWGTCQDSKLQIQKLRKMVTRLKVKNVQPFDGEKYVLVVHPIVAEQLRSDPDFTTWNAPQNAEKMFNGEVGIIEGCRIIETTNAISFTAGNIATGVTAYLSTLLGKGAFAITEFSGDGGIKFNTFTGQDSTNVNKQALYAGYIWTGACKVLNAACGYGILTFEGA